MTNISLTQKHVVWLNQGCWFQIWCQIFHSGSSWPWIRVSLINTLMTETSISLTQKHVFWINWGRWSRIRCLFSHSGSPWISVTWILSWFCDSIEIIDWENSHHFKIDAGSVLSFSRVHFCCCFLYLSWLYKGCCFLTWVHSPESGNFLFLIVLIIELLLFFNMSAFNWFRKSFTLWLLLFFLNHWETFLLKELLVKCRTLSWIYILCCFFKMTAFRKCLNVIQKVFHLKRMPSLKMSW